MKRSWTVIAALLCTVAVLASTTSAAFAAYNHLYSYAEHNSAGAHYTAIKNSRPYSDLGTYTCTLPYQNPIYEPTWLVIDAYDWLELGIEHQCNGALTFYSGYAKVNSAGNNFVFYNRNNYTVSPTTTPTLFEIYRSGGNSWHYVYGSTEVDTITWTKVGTAAEAGIESYEDAVTVPVNHESSLAYELDQGAWTLWSGTNPKYVDTPTMCGAYDSAYAYRYSENVSC
jgi:hypothetical protein